MKYLVEFYYGYAGRAIVKVPFKIDTDWDPSGEDKLIYAAKDLGLDVTYTPEELMNDYGKDHPEDWTDEDWDDFEDFIDGWELQWLEERDLYFQSTGFHYEPAPPDATVGILQRGEKIHFDRYRGGRR